MNDFIPLSRSVEATAIPSGHITTLPEGTVVSITQSLGGTYTVHASIGGLYRIAAQDADAMGLDVVPQARPVADGPFSEALVWETLKGVYDPEIPVNIVDLGLIYNLKAEVLQGASETYKVLVQMTLTAPGCGMGPALASDARQRISELPGVAEADVQLVWDPPWGPERISAEGREKLGIA